MEEIKNKGESFLDCKHKKELLIYSFCHFLVDFLCAIFALGKLTAISSSNDEAFYAIVIYNFFAFAFQVPLGMIMDKFKKYKLVSIIGFVLIGISYCIASFTSIKLPVLLAIIVGIGNAFFHLEGGTNVGKFSNQKAFLNGFFVAPGALGIFLGTMFAKNLIDTFVPFTAIVIAITLLLFVQKEDKEIHMSCKAPAESLKYIASMLGLIGISIIVRAIGGSILTFDWKSEFILALGFTVAVVLGKAFGGKIADKFGFRNTMIFSLAVSCILLLLGTKIWILAYLGIFLFNVPMSITLTMLENTLGEENLGMAVGLNTMFLFVGYLITVFNTLSNNYIVFVSSIVIAILTILVALNMYLGGKGDAKNKKV